MANVQLWIPRERTCSNVCKSNVRIGANTKLKGRRRSASVVKRFSASRTSTESGDDTRDAPKLHIVIAGGGLGGLFLAICLTKKGFNVTVVERTQEYRPYGGPIQLASNGTSVLKATSERLYKAILENSRPFWGTISGIKDGYTADWMFTFDAITEIPRRSQLPFAVCVDRSDLQRCLLDEIASINSDKSCGNTDLKMGSRVKSYAQDFTSGKVSVKLENSTKVEGDILVGADGIWSCVRAQMLDEVGTGRGSKSTASHTGYRLFSDLPVHETEDFFDVGYCAYIGPDHYFVTCPDRHGRIQWYAFIKAGPDSEQINEPREYLLDKFSDWAPEISTLISISRDKDISQRDLWDRPPCLKGWSDGNVVLLGDSCHATMPNIGQGSGLAFEDAFVLSDLLLDVKHPSEALTKLKMYYAKRLFRTAAIQGLGRMKSEAIKILTPLLPIKPLIDFVVSPFLPLVFEAQFGFCYSFTPSKESITDSLSNANAMAERHRRECRKAWQYHEGVEDQSIEPRISS